MLIKSLFDFQKSIEKNDKELEFQRRGKFYKVITKEHERQRLQIN